MLQEFKYKPIEFVKSLYFINDTDKTREELVKDCERIYSLTAESNQTYKKNYLIIGNLLLKIKNNKSYVGVLSRDKVGDHVSPFDVYAHSFLAEPFYAFCQRYFNISKTTAFTLMQVAFLFSGSEDGTAQGRYSDFSYSQLVELLSFKMEDRYRVSSDMTIAEIRALKKMLYPKEEKEKKASEESDESPTPAPKYVFCDMSTKKKAFQNFVKQLVDNLSYGITVKGKTQGGYAFASALWDYLEERGFFNHEEQQYSQEVLSL